MKESNKTSPKQGVASTKKSGTGPKQSTRKTSGNNPPVGQIPVKGVGDKIEQVLNSKGIKPATDLVKRIIWGKKGEDCGCDERKQTINAFEWKGRKPQRCLSEKQFNYLSSVLPQIKGSVSMPVMEKIGRIHAVIFDYQFDSICSDCPAKNKRMIDQLRKIMTAYKPEA